MKHKEKSIDNLLKNIKYYSEDDLMDEIDEIIDNEENSRKVNKVKKNERSI